MICTIEACEKPTRSRNSPWCETHYYRWRRHGDPLAVHPNASTHKPCRFDGCTRMASSLGWCKSHYDKAHRHGSPLGRLDLGYSGSHDRVRRVRGSARQHACVRCGVPAVQWSYSHADPAELREQGMPYSPDPAFYEPMCVPCHKRMDLDYRRITIELAS